MNNMLKCINCGRLHSPDGYYVEKANGKCLKCGSDMKEVMVEDNVMGMGYILKNVSCEYCNQKINEIKVIHGIAYDSFICPNCNKENKRY